MSGVPLLIALAAGIALMIISISKWKVHPFLAIMGTALVLALVTGLPLNEVPNVIGTGFGSAFTSVGLVIVFGALVGSVLEKTGAALKIADALIRLTGKRYPEAALVLMGRVVSMSVFCDSAFVILDPVRRALAQRTARSGAACTAALSLGLYITQCCTPPAPGPVAAANAIYGGMGLQVNYLVLIAVTLLCSLLPTAAAFLFSRCVKVQTADDKLQEQDAQQAYEKLLAQHGKLPNVLLSLVPIVLPLVLMGAAGAATIAGKVPALLAFLGSPAIALGAGLLAALVLLANRGQMSALPSLTEETLKTVAPILFVIAAGNVLGEVISSTRLAEVIESNASALHGFGLLFPFLLAVLLKTALGSSTVALTATAGMLAPLMLSLGFSTPMDAAMVVCAISAGSMVVCHANDSYFWVIVSLGKLELKDGYKIQTVGSLVVGAAALINVLLVSFMI